MKQYTTRFFKSIAAGFLVFPLIYIFLAAISFDIPLSSCMRILLSPFYYIVTVCAVIAGYGLWEMRRWSWYFFVAAQVLIGYENAIFVSEFAESHHKVVVLILSFLLQLIISFRIAREIRVPYFFPKIRWWENNPRYKLTVPAILVRETGEVLSGDVLDFSMTGCFIKFRFDMVQGERVVIKLTIFGSELNCPGTIVWSTLSAVTHPKGIGVKFDYPTREQKRAFRTITSRLRKISAHYRRSRYLMSQEEFLKRLEELEGTGLDRASRQ